jgi:hypothetical protein
MPRAAGGRLRAMRFQSGWPGRLPRRPILRTESNSDDVEVVATGEWFGASLPPTFDPPEPANKANYSLLWGLMWQMFL